GDRDRQIADVRDRDREWTLQPDRFAPGLGATMKRHRGLPGASSTDLDLSPTDAADTESEHFRDGFLRGPPTREMQDVRAAIHLLPLGIDAIQESPRVPLQHVSNPNRLNDVDANLRNPNLLVSFSGDLVFSVRRYRYHHTRPCPDLLHI